MKKQYKIQLPKGMVVKNDAHVEITDDCIYVEAELVKEQKYEPKDGDFIFVKSRLRPYITKYSFIGIFCNIIKDVGCTPILLMYASLKDDNRLVYRNSIEPYNNSEYIRPATEKEKKLLIEKLAEVGKKWNPKTKAIEDVRWRAKIGESFYAITPFGQVDFLARPPKPNMDDDYKFYQVGNYFKSREAAEKIAEQIRGIFQNSKAE